MAQAAAAQLMFPRFTAEGGTHTGDCPCPQCDDSANARNDVSADGRAGPDGDRRPDALSKAKQALARMKEKKRVRALKMELALAESERETQALLARQQQAFSKVSEDERLGELLRLRQAGVPVDEALAKVEAHAPRRGAAPVTQGALDFEAACDPRLHRGQTHARR